MALPANNKREMNPIVKKNLHKKFRTLKGWARHSAGFDTRDVK